MPLFRDSGLASEEVASLRMEISADSRDRSCALCEPKDAERHHERIESGVWNGWVQSDAWLGPCDGFRHAELSTDAGVLLEALK